MAVLGQKVRCKNCGNKFTASATPKDKTVPDAGRAGKKPSAAPSKPPAQRRSDPAESSDKNPYGFMEDEEALEKITKTREKTSQANDPNANRPRSDTARNPYGLTELDLAPRCPSCAKELEDEDSVICLNCGYNTITRMHTRTQSTFATTGSEQFLWLLPGILCAVFVLCLLGGAIAIVAWWLNWEPDKSWETVFVKLVQCGVIWTVIIIIFVGYIAGRFAFRRLVLNPIRPETQKKK